MEDNVIKFTVAGETDSNSLKRIEKDYANAVAKGVEKGQGLIKGKPITLTVKATGREALIDDVKKKGGNWWTQVKSLSKTSSKAKLTAMRDALALSEHDYEILGSRETKYAAQKKMIEDQRKEYFRMERLLDQKDTASAKNKEDKKALKKRAAWLDLNTEKALERQRAKYALSDERAAAKKAARDERLAREAAENEEKVKLQVQSKYESARFMASRLGRYGKRDYEWMAKSQPSKLSEQRSLVDSLKLSEQEETLARMSVRTKDITEGERDQIQEAKDKLKYLKEQEKVLAKMEKEESKSEGGRGILLRAFGAIGRGLGKVGTDVVRRMYRMTIRDIARELLALSKEGIQILADWDRTFGNNTSHAAETVDHIAAKWYELKKAVGAAAMPIIQLLQPAIDWVLDKVTSLVNWVNQFARSWQGYTDYMKATYRVIQKNESAAKALKKVIFGFDELNILPDDNGGSGSSGISLVDYDPTEIDSDINESANNAKDAVKGVKKVLETMHQGRMDAEAAYQAQVDAEIEQAGKAIEWIKEKFGNVKQTVKDVIESFKTDVANGREQLRESVERIKEKIGEAKQKIIDAWDSVKTDFKNAVDQMKESWDGFKQKWENVLAVIKKPFEDAFNGVKQFILDHPWLAKLLGVEPGSFDTTINITTKFTTDTYISPNTRELIDLLKLNVLDDSGRSTTTARLQDLLAFENKYTNPGGGFAGLNLRASGGSVPNTGTLIMANERGPEVIANMGNATGIMNTNQMQAAIASGNSVVVDAIYSAVGSVISAVNNKPSDVYLDGNKVGAMVTKYQNNRSSALGQSVLAR